MNEEAQKDRGERGAGFSRWFTGYRIVNVDASQVGRLAGEGDTLLLSGNRRTELRPEALTWILLSFQRFKAPQLVSALTVTPRRTSC